MLTRIISIQALQSSAPKPNINQPHRPLRIRFGERLRCLRQSHQYTQLQLAVHLGIDRSFLSDVERGKKNTTLLIVDTIAQGFQISLAELMQDL